MAYDWRRPQGEERRRLNPDHMWTNILMRNLLGDDSPLMPTPVHFECWQAHGEPSGFERALQAQTFVYRIKGQRGYQWSQGESLPAGAECWFCHEEV